MYEAVFMAATGLTNQQRRMDTVANNIANVNTVGYKSARLDFKDALYTAGLVPGPAYTPEGSQQKGHGVMMAAISRTFETGNLIDTGNDLDFAIEGNGFFELTDTNGQLVYTKGGNMYISNEENGQFLVNGQGHYLQNEGGTSIRLPDGTTRIATAEDGSLTFYADDTPIMTDKFGIYSFPNKFGLSDVGDNNFTATITSGERTPAAGIKVRQGFLEASTVNTAQEMTLLIRAQRAFSLAGRALTTADEMEGLANNMKR